MNFQNQNRKDIIFYKWFQFFGAAEIRTNSYVLTLVRRGGGGSHHKYSSHGTSLQMEARRKIKITCNLSKFNEDHFSKCQISVA